LDLHERAERPPYQDRVKVVPQQEASLGLTRKGPTATLYQVHTGQLFPPFKESKVRRGLAPFHLTVR